MNILSQIQQKVSDRRRERVVRKAIDRAMESFVRRHPRWAASLVDGFLLRGKEQALLENRVRPADLALAWTEQIYYRDETRRAAHVAELSPITAEFLALLGQEIRKTVRV